MSDLLYRKELLRLAADAHGAGHLSAAERRGSAFNPTCGDRVDMEIALTPEGRVEALAHEAHACVLAQASCAILGRHAPGHSRAEIAALRRDVAAMLKTAKPAPDKPFDAYGAFKGAVEYESRHACVLLPLDALLAAFDQA